MSKYKLLILSSFVLLLNGNISAANPGDAAENTSSYFENRIEEVDATALNDLMQGEGAHDEFYILDVRAEDDYKAGHVPGSINLPYTRYNSFKGSGIEFPELKKEENALYFVVCYDKDCPLANAAAKKLSFGGYKVKTLAGGFEHWANQKLPVEF